MDESDTLTAAYQYMNFRELVGVYFTLLRTPGKCELVKDLGAERAAANTIGYLHHRPRSAAPPALYTFFSSPPPHVLPVVTIPTGVTFVVAVGHYSSLSSGSIAPVFNEHTSQVIAELHDRGQLQCSSVIAAPLATWLQWCKHFAHTSKFYVRASKPSPSIQF